MNATEKEGTGEKKPQQSQGFGDFFECSDIDNQDYSQFMNDNSQIIIGEQSRRNTLLNNQEEAEEVDEDISAQLQQLKVAVVADNRIDLQPPAHANKSAMAQPQGASQLLPPDPGSPSPAVSERERQKKTKETMKIEPLPIFDCVFCIKDSKFVFQKLSEKHLARKYRPRRQFRTAAERIETEVEELAKAWRGQEEQQPLGEYLQASLELEIMIEKLNFAKVVENVSTYGGLSPIQVRQSFKSQSKDSLPTSSNLYISRFLSKHIPCPSLTNDDILIKSREIYLQLKFSRLNSMNKYSNNNNKVSATNIYEGNQLTQPTIYYGGNIQTMYEQEIKLTDQELLARNQFQRLQEAGGNLINMDEIMEEHLIDGVNIKQWALTRRQKVLQDISYCSSSFNVYSPHFSSRNSSSLASNEDHLLGVALWEDGLRSRRESSKEAEAFEDFISQNSPKAIKGTISQSNFGTQAQVALGRDTSSDMSVAEERDTITNAAPGITPNISRIMNMCSISKIEQHSMMTVMESIQNHPPKSALSSNMKKHKKTVFKMHQSNNSHGNAFRINHLVKESDQAAVETPLEIRSIAPEEELKEGPKDRLQVLPSTRNDQSKMSSFASHFKYQTANSTKQSLISSAQKQKGSQKEKVFSFNKKDNKRGYLNVASSGNNYTPHLLKPILKKQHPPTQKNLSAAKKYNSQGAWDAAGTSTTISFNKMSEQKNKIAFEDQEQRQFTKKPSSNNLLVVDNSSLMNPYETMQNSPVVKDVNIGQGLQTSTINVPGVFGSYDQSKEYDTNSTINSPGKYPQPHPGVTKSQQQPLKNSQSLQNINLQPRVFITRNVKFRKQAVVNTGQNSARKTPKAEVMTIQESKLKQVPTENFLKKPQTILEEQEWGRERSPNSQMKYRSSLEYQEQSKTSQKLQMKRQRLQRDIMLSKVYNSNLSAQSLPFYNGSSSSNHKKNYSSIHQSQLAPSQPQLLVNGLQDGNTLSSSSFQKSISKKSGLKSVQQNWQKKQLKIEGETQKSHEIKNIQFYSRYLDGLMMKTGQNKSSKHALPVVNNFV